MAKFRDSSGQADIAAVLSSAPTPEPAPPQRHASESASQLHDRSIGDLLRAARDLTAEQVEQILAHQQSRGIRFGEAAVALGLVRPDDVLYALSQQFHYPYAPNERYETSAELVALNQPFSRQAEAVRALRSQLLSRVFGNGDQRAIAVVSADQGDGKSFLCANLAVSLAQLGGRTLLLDADLRGPRLHSIFGLPLSPGLSTILVGRAESRAIQQVPAVPDLYVMAGGAVPPNPLELIERPAFGLLVKELSTKFDHVVIDTPAAVYGSDALVIGARCGAALVIARRNATRVGDVQQLLGDLSQMRSKIAGVVYNEF